MAALCRKLIALALVEDDVRFTITMTRNVVNRLSNRFDLVRILVRYFDIEFFLNCHDNLYSVKAVETKIIREARCCGYLGWVLNFVESLDDVQDSCLDIRFRE